MKLNKLAENIGAKVVNPGNCQKEVEFIYAGDRVSDLLGHASSSTLIVSNLAIGQLIRVAELVDIAGICLVNGNRPDQKDMHFISEHGITVLVSPAALFETCGRAYRCLFEKSG